MEPGPSQDTYCKLLDEKIQLLADYRDATLEIKGSLDRKSRTTPHKGIIHRQRLIKRIDRVDGSIRTLNIRDHDKRGADGIAARIESIERLLGSIVEVDTDCMHHIGLERDNMKKEIIGLRQKRSRTTGYHTAGVVPAKFVDTRIR